MLSAMRTDRYGRGRELTFGLLVAAILAILALAPSAAHAAGCTDTWTNTAGGSWSTGTNWSKKAPPTSEEEACITENGTYTVELKASETHVKSLTVGGTSGTQTLAVNSSCSFNSVLVTSSGLEVGAHGAVALSNAETCGNGVTVKGPITNAGKISSEPGIGGHRAIEGGLTNTGTLAINTNTEFDAKAAALSNQGAIDVATGKELILSSETSFTNGSGGSIVGTGTGTVSLRSGTSFTEGAGTTSGTLPVILDDAALSYTGGGESTIAIRGEGSTLSGASVAKQSLLVQTTCAENTKLVAASGFTNAGSITMTNTETCADNVTLKVSSGTLTNTGTITSEPGNGGNRRIEGEFTNKGTFAVNANTEYTGTSPQLLNEGAINVAENKQLTVAGKGSLTNGTGGKITAAAGGDVFLSNAGTTFTEGAGTTGGASTKPVILDDAALVYTGSGSSAIFQRGEGGTLTGNISSGQSLTLETDCAENTKTTAASGFTNAGSITMTNTETCADNVTLKVSSGTLTNTGTITSEPGNGGIRRIEGEFTNKGTFAVNANTEYTGTSPQLLNEGAINVAENKQLTVAGKGSLTNGTGGKITAAAGANVFLNASGTTFTEGAGTTGGASTKPVILDDAALVYTGSGSSAIFQRGEGGTLAGNLASGQSLTLESTCSENTKTTAASGFTNAGSITMSNADTCANNAALVVSSGTLTNTGTITTVLANGGIRRISGNLTNKGTLTIGASSEYSGTSLLKNDGAINIATGVTLSAPGGATIENEGGAITATGSGVLSQRTGTFVQGAGKASGTLPVIVDDGTLDYVGTGASTIAVRGTITLGGTAGKKGLINKGQTLALQTTCSENVTVTSPGFLNSGTIKLTSGESCGNTATLRLGSGTLQNKGTIDVETPHGGNREIEANLVNEKIVSLLPGSSAATLTVAGKFTQTSKGQLKTQIAGSSLFGTINASGAVTLAGKLALKQIKPFLGKVGESFTTVKGSSLSGTFSKVSGNTIKGGNEYAPVYTSTTMSLVVK